MGEVYIAEDARLHRRVAIKRIPPELASNAALRQRLLIEARAAARLDHPNICGIHEVGEDDQGPFIVMALVEGETLAARLSRGPLPLATVLDIFGRSSGKLPAAPHACRTKASVRSEAYDRGSSGQSSRSPRS
jgi:serine/threonine protein kinase